eukprot:TRINITY_DN28499_c0_g1_i1.p6 TRINITY_DN28499_c0_g1~~TRINITY_DN28499_c0_g1_i1.p6  ORF type:complete len:318 (+),score=20.29 TRINITY_DN28499_c0_g1_i1:3780-4733(+)
MDNIFYWLETDNGTGKIIKENKQIHKLQLQILSSADTIHEWLNRSKTYWRKKTLEKFECFLGQEIYGEVMEIGAGTAWCSSILSKKENISKVFTVEFDLFSIKELMPKVFDALEADVGKIQLVLGSFNDIRLQDNSLDFIFSMGALHHSQNLFRTYSELYRVLKPGGFVLISEPCYSNSLRLEEEYIWREAEKSLGIKNKDNGDQQFRVCQYEAYALEAGFNPYVYTFDSEVGVDIDRQLEDIEKGDDVFKNREVYDGFAKKTYYPYFAQGLTREKVISCKELGEVRLVETAKYDKCMIILQKPYNTNYKTFSDMIY